MKKWALLGALLVWAGAAAAAADQYIVGGQAEMAWWPFRA